jgi:phosphotriesterase-related protein
MNTQPENSTFVPFIRTILGDIAPAKLGMCYAHEHIIIDESYPTEKNPDFLLNSVAQCVVELRAFHQAGGRAMVDSMPADAGRNALQLAEVSRQSGVHILCPTGLHLAKYYPQGHWSGRLPATDLAQIFIADINEGIDANDYGGPYIRRTNYKAGVIKIAGSRDKLTDLDLKIFTAAAQAHRATGCPILTHTEQGTAALEQVQRLADLGVDLRHVCLSHTDRCPDIAYHRRILASPVRIEFDSAFRWKPGEPNHTLELITALLPEFPDQIMLGMDAARRTYWKAYGGAPGLSFLLDTFAPRLRSVGISQILLDKVFITTPADCYQFIPPRTGLQ